jgi:2-hydroxy-6-oxonona-2,4-dienedioate hydrolase
VTDEAPYESLWTALREVAFCQSWIDVGGIRTRYAEAGSTDRPVLLMLHGTGGHWETFARNLAAHSPHFRCVAPDMVGNGFTDKPDEDYEIPVYIDHLLGFMDAVGIERASVLGCSLGSWVAARLALDHPDRVDKLIFVSTAGKVATASNMARIRAERTKAVEDPNWASIKAMFDHLLAEEHNRIPDLIALRQAIYRRPDMRHGILRILALQDPEIRDRNLLTEEEWGRIEAPTLVIASGEGNEYTDTSRWVAARLPNATLVEMPHVKHWPHWEDAEFFNEASLKFLLG